MDDDENRQTAAASSAATAAAATSSVSVAAAVSTTALAVASPLSHSIASYPTVSFHALQRAQKTIADFMQTYLFIFHAQPDRCDSNASGGDGSGPTDGGVADGASAPGPPSSTERSGPAAAAASDLGLPSSTGVPSGSTLQLMFRLLPLLTFVSATVYQLDEENEEHNQRCRIRREQQRENEAKAKGAGAAAESVAAAASPAVSRSTGKRGADDGSSVRARSHNPKRPRLDADSGEPASTSSSNSSSNDSSDSEDESTSDGDSDSDSNSDGVAASSSPSYSVLLSVLRSQGLLTERVHAELRKGLLYWQLERQICAQLHDIAEYRDRKCHGPAQSSAPAGGRDDANADPSVSSAHAFPPPPSPSLSLTDVHMASACKSFDYRVLNLLCYGAASPSRPVDEAALRALALNERLVDLHDDLVDYEDDILANSFNIYRCYVAHYGAAEAPAKVAARIQRLEEEFAARMVLLPRHLQDAFRAREARAMAEDSARSSSGGAGGGGGGAVVGPAASLKQDGSTWTIPPPIANESAWRREVCQAEKLSRALQDKTR